MRDLSPQIREVAGSLLRDDKVDLVIGYERGSLPLRTSPCFVRDPADVEKLVWNPCCENNLASYLLVNNERVGIVAKGCDARAIIGAAIENQVDRDNVVIIAVPCQGILDRHSVERHIGNKEILAASYQNGDIIVSGEGFKESLPLAEFLCDTCQSCEHRTAPVFDIQVGELAQVADLPDSYGKADALEAQSSDDRRAFFEQEFDRCIRCYACRQACPFCYCKECFVDETQPMWIGKTGNASDTLIFQVVRAFHVAGRCVSCGACSRACPMGIDLQTLHRKLAKEVKQLYGFESGLDLDTDPPLSTFRLDDPEEFIK